MISWWPQNLVSVLFCVSLCACLMFIWKSNFLVFLIIMDDCQNFIFLTGVIYYNYNNQAFLLKIFWWYKMFPIFSYIIFQMGARFPQNTMLICTFWLSLIKIFKYVIQYHVNMIFEISFWSQLFCRNKGSTSIDIIKFLFKYFYGI